jgi:hypothetical protein
VFFCGAPRAAPGPVADTVTPMVTSANAEPANVAATAHTIPRIMNFMLLSLVVPRQRKLPARIL